MAKRSTKYIVLSCKAPMTINERLERLARRDRRSKSAQMLLLLEWALKRRESGKAVA